EAIWTLAEEVGDGALEAAAFDYSLEHFSSLAASPDFPEVATPPHLQALFRSDFLRVASEEDAASTLV
ncbi:hypothetical protein T484DRAFT_1892691, partial [Baffinella frigidus]